MRVRATLALVAAAGLGLLGAVAGLGWAQPGGDGPGPGPGDPPGGVEDSYHGQLGYTGDRSGGGPGMLEKWCALPNFSFAKEGGIGDGTFGWTSKPCNDCHIGARWNPTKQRADCTLCHEEEGDEPANEKCMGCHWKDTAKRGDIFDSANDVHIAAGMKCHDCHERTEDDDSDHQFLKGDALDTTEPTMEGTLSCASCHDPDEPHADVRRGSRLDAHTDKVACETCHTGTRQGSALAGRDWTTFVSGKPKTWKRPPGWAPVHKWYDRTGPGAPGSFDLPILGTAERRDADGAQIFPFNAVTVTWFVERAESPFDDVIVVADVKAADADGDGTTTLAEMQVTYPGATLITRDMTFSINHSVRTGRDTFRCRDCHGRRGWLLDWEALGYDGDPRSSGRKSTNKDRKSTTGKKGGKR